ncbi:uncharacterized protein LOC112341899 [Selaginella moellendorffii]|uniref:uncharacterized protein LOC112341899 n=1 Tax=Selaginella moellendorffii TaxID=88036 RepID=UPI000D1D0184|nr:uncharacterized protein LOC112341899 [Selaginella moellendorffii]|eukprot:XP_024518648.1 uncharacterized protein LOC112341899 [Selaginella moellendorffii]
MDEIELLRETMLRQELVFTQQVRELHRLYQRQKILMTDMGVINPSRDQRCGTRDLLHSLEEDRIDSSGFSRRAKRQKTFDLEQIPDDNDEETEYVFDTSSRARNSLPADPTMNFLGKSGRDSSHINLREIKLEDQQPSRPLQEMALFPTLPRGREVSDDRQWASFPAAKNGLEWQHQNQPWISQNLGRTAQVGDPWNVFQITGQSYQAENYGYNTFAAIPEMMIMASKSYANGNAGVEKSFAPSWQPYSYITQEILKNNTFIGHNQSNLSSRTSWFSSANNIPSKPLPPLVENNLPLKPDTATIVSNITHAVDSEKSLSRRKTSSEVGEEVKIDSKVTEKNRVLGAGTSCTEDLARNLELQDASTTNSVVINSVAKEGLSKVGLSKARTMSMEDSLDLVTISDTITWAATILLSFSPRCSTTTVKLCKNRDVEGASKPGVSDLKLFKSVVTMLKQQSGGKLMKSGRKFVVSDDDQSPSKGKTIAALFQRTLSSATKEKDHQHYKKRRRKKKIEVVAAEEVEEEQSEEEDEEEEEEVMCSRTRRSSLRESVHSNGSAVETMTRTTAATPPPPRKSRSLSQSTSSSAAAAAQTHHTWLWGDVTRRKRMQRPRHQHQPTLRPQHHQVRCQN